jgi:hypothetical protein
MTHATVNDSAVAELPRLDDRGERYCSRGLGQRTAPVNAILAVDSNFHHHIPRLLPFRPEMRDALEATPRCATGSPPSLGQVAAPASLFAFVAWQQGDGALANVALDRALADSRRYSMGKLLRRAPDAGAPPSMARLPMTPAEVAASYDAQEAGAESGPSEAADVAEAG